MSEDKSETETTAASKKAVELVAYEANSGYPSMIYPELRDFFESRKLARRELRAERAKANYQRALYIAQKGQEFYADESNDGEFDDYTAGREWNRTHSATAFSAVEGRYYDFTQGDRRDPLQRTNAENPNSWEQLYEATTHREVKWIIENCMGNESEALTLLGYMPATREELWELAKDRHDMCRTFDRYMEQAEAAGLFDDFDSRGAGLKELAALQSYVRRAYGSAYVRDMSQHVQRLIKALREDAAAQVAEAKAEWQKLDEAQAENATRNRSEAAKAAWARRKAALPSGSDQLAEAVAEQEAKAVIEDDQPDAGFSFDEEPVVREASMA